jgi:hypothetical protein
MFNFLPSKPTASFNFRNIGKNHRMISIKCLNLCAFAALREAVFPGYLNVQFGI